MKGISYYIEKFFKYKVLLISKNPKIFIYIPVIITILSIYTISNTKIITKESLEIFLPKTLKAYEDAEKIKQFFSSNELIRDEYYILDKKIAYFIIEDTTDKKNILRKSVLEIVSTIHNQVMKIRTHNKKNFNDICLKRNTICQQHPIVLLMRKDNVYETTKLMARYPFINFGNMTIDNTFIFGDVKLNKTLTDKRGNSQIIKARSIKIPYQLDENVHEIEEWMCLFDKELSKIIPKKGINLFYTTSTSLPRELSKNGEDLIQYLPWMGLLLIISTTIFCISKKNPISRILLGFFSLLNAGMAVITSIGILIGIGFPFLEIVYIIPFLMLSIGTDNMFLMLQAWKEKNEKANANDNNVENVLSKAIGEVGCSILMATLTDSISYFIGSFSTFYIVKVFCTYCTLSIIVMFIYQSSFLTGIMIITCKMEINDKSTKLGATQLEYYGCKLSEVYSTIIEKYTELLEKKLSPLIVGVIFLLYLLLSGYYFININIGIQLETLSQSDSHVTKEIIASERLYNDYGLYSLVVINVSNISLSSYQERNKLIKLYEKFTSTTNLLSPDVFFLRIFNKVFPYTFQTEEIFEKFLLLTLTKPSLSKYKSDFSYNKKNDSFCSKINYIKMVFRQRQFSPSNIMKRHQHLKQILNESNYTGFVYDNSFIKIDQDKLTIESCIQNVIIATITIIGVFILIIPKAIRSLGCVIVSILSINIGVGGLLSATGVRLDIISMITMVMSIGYSVDYVSHVVLHYLSQKENKLKKSLKFITLPLLQASTTTILGVIILININSYIVKTFTITVVSVVGVGLLHSLLFLPVGLRYLVKDMESLDNKTKDLSILNHNNNNNNNLSLINTSKDFGIINAYYS
ncbi:Sterol-sensing domain and Patched family-containing protein [Strongyloides ratti]|uniref:Sterol-sensing domain and Patched family-containing protein n=1 Tax=Strongyloides ratti TaxID=34506 RepID=A0A090LCJ8_STRRB|nr:Sterol-sensing domain and Patched family-containing protein [Strongyloides ratti]CEF65843.1 Sterol-sensing domain and Patched family-containing protein [Strongyloides ratti]